MSGASLVNGAPGPLPEGDRGLAYGDGLFETIAVHDQRPWLWQAHVDRLAQGCERLGLSPPPQAVLLQEALALAPDKGPCVIKIILTRGAGGRGYAPPSQPSTNRVVSRHPWPADIEALALRGVRLRTLSLRLAVQPALGGIKHLNRLEQVLAARELEGAGDDDGLLLDQQNFLVSALAANLFLVSGRRLLTPRLDRCGVRGVVRGQILRDFKARCELRRMRATILDEVDEVFLCNSVRGVIPVTGIDGRVLKAGPVTRELQAWFRDRVTAP